MSTRYDEQLEELRAGHQARVTQTGESPSRMREMTGTATAKTQAMKSRSVRRESCCRRNCPPAPTAAWHPRNSRT